jgi:hypothetical protein
MAANVRLAVMRPRKVNKDSLAFWAGKGFPEEVVREKLSYQYVEGIEATGSYQKALAGLKTACEGAVTILKPALEKAGFDGIAANFAKSVPYLLATIEANLCRGSAMAAVVRATSGLPTPPEAVEEADDTPVVKMD